MIKRISALGVVLVVIALGAVAYSVFKPPKAASEPIEALPVADETVGTESSAAAAPASAIGSDSSTSPVIFEIVQRDSEVRFIIDEVLNGAPNTVVGVTDQIAGEISVDVNEPSKSQIGPILVNARTLATDNELRNRAIKNRILDTNAFEFVRFTPTELMGLPDSVAVGESLSFQIVGDLTVRYVTNQVTFDVVVTPTSETQLKGLASTTILYADFDLTIPRVPRVASVDDEVILEIEFIAVAK